MFLKLFCEIENTGWPHRRRTILTIYFKTRNTVASNVVVEYYFNVILKHWLNIGCQHWVAFPSTFLALYESIQTFFLQITKMTTENFCHQMPLFSMLIFLLLIYKEFSYRNWLNFVFLSDITRGMFGCLKVWQEIKHSGKI